MANKEMKLNAIMRFLVADNDQDREAAMNDMLNYISDPVMKPEQTPENCIRQVLLELGVPEHIKGHRFLVTAISEAVKNAELIDYITRELYPTVASNHNTTASRVERAIRHAVELAWDRGDLDALQHYFGNTVSISKGKPTNSEFIARVSNVVRQRLESMA
jgi:two-component system response regulator (stage 0 sporulation protein A)